MSLWKRKQPAPETRSYTEQISEARQAAAEGSALNSEQLGVREIVVGLYARAFASANITGIAQTIHADTMALIGRALADKGQALVYFENGEAMPVSTWDISGGSCDPLTWRYKITYAVPNGSKSRTLPALDVLHFRINPTAARPWEGRSPFDIALSATTLAVRAECALSNELRTPIGGVIPIPNGSPPDTVTSLRNDLKGLKGDFVTLESMAASWGEGAQGNRDWAVVRYKPEPDGETVKTYTESQQTLLAACGVPVELATSAEGSGTREAWRRFLHSTLQPVGNVIVAELRRKLTGTPAIDFDALMASDLQGRARAFQSMVGAGMAIERAATLAGLLLDD